MTGKRRNYILDELSRKNARLVFAEDGFGSVNNIEYKYISQIKNLLNDNCIIKDVGIKTIISLKKEIEKMDIIFWNGTLGIVEDENYSNGSFLLLELLNNVKGKVIIGGGDTAGFCNNYKNNFYHISTGGGASIDYLGKD